MKNLILIGGGGHCKSCIDVIEGTNNYNIIGILDTQDKVGQKVLDYGIIGTDDDIEKYVNQDCYFLITLGQIESADLRKKIFEKIVSLNGKFATIISKNAYVSKHATVSQGTIVMHGAIINADAKIGKNCTINTKALIEHDCLIGDNCHISVGAVVAGGVKIEDECFIGANSTLVQGIHLPPKTFVKASSLIK